MQPDPDDPARAGSAAPPVPRRRPRPAALWAPALLGFALLAACAGPPPPEDSEPEPTESVILVDSDGGGSGGPGCTLRDAIAAAEQDAPVGGCPAGEGADVIVLAAGLTVLLSEVDNETDGPNGLPAIGTEVVVRGQGSVVTRAPGSPPFRLFHVRQGGNLRLEDVTLRGGQTEEHDGGAVYVAGGTLVAVDAVIEDNVVGQGRAGGGVYNAGGDVTLERVVMRANSAPGERETDSGFAAGTGAAVANAGGSLSVAGSELTLNGALISGEIGVIAALGFDAYTEVVDTRIADNEALGIFSEGELRLAGVTVTRSANLVFGGVISAGVAFLDDVTLRSNSAEAVSGLSNSGFMRVRGSTVSDHETFDGFTGVLNEGVMEVIDATISGNVGATGTAAGGGVTNRGRLTLVRTLVVGNVGGQGGGVRNEGELILVASVVDDNEAEQGGGVYDLGEVVLRDGSVVGGAVGNRATGRGGGVYVADGPGAERLVLTGGSAVRGNVAGAEGGGVYAEVELELGLCRTCAVEGNAAGAGVGGGIYAPGLGFGSIFAPGIRDNQPDGLAPGVLLAVPVAGSADDAEEIAAAVASPPLPAGAVATTGPSLELRADPALGVAQHVGLRFQGVPVPPGASLVDARVVFTAAAAGDGEAAVDMGVEDAVAAAAFTETAFDVSSRPTLGTTRWDIEPWEAAGDSGPAQASPSLRNQLQQLVDAPGWAAGNPVAVVLGPGQGAQAASRSAHAFDADPASAPRLWLLYYEPPAEEPPAPPEEPPED